MVLSVFKSGDELFNQGIDLIKRKEFAKARKNFEKTIGKSGREAVLAGIYIDIIDACLDNNNPARYSKLAASLENMKDEFEFGLTEIDPRKVSTECSLLAERMNIGRMQGNSTATLEEKGNKFLEVARKYQSQIGNDTIVISEIVGLQVNTGIKEALYVQAYGYEALASAAVMSDPKKAAELLQNAYTCRKQLGEDGQEEMNRIKAYSKSVKCWICGRPATGEGVHFLAMSSEISPFMRKSDDDILQSAPTDYNSVYVCRPCYTSISRRSDEIAKKYHDVAMQEMRAMEARLRAEISSMYSMMSMRR
jgi:tetratricopeptide (TPR) repeat protein